MDLLPRLTASRKQTRGPGNRLEVQETDSRSRKQTRGPGNRLEVQETDSRSRETDSRAFQ
ncbi:hypothetical protein DPMN_075630 [Dreissena polymorpha]|uniref:Uncharacterized protein n=1 Tax=Dreissena polymorpha TaxID=45954 RepID=A0A9D4BMP5_DREPO|nr:hypothetical protein DPMN_075630 [Dreissena polymorpha]